MDLSRKLLNMVCSNYSPFPLCFDNVVHTSLKLRVYWTISADKLSFVLNLYLFGKEELLCFTSKLLTKSLFPGAFFIIFLSFLLLFQELNSKKVNLANVSFPSLALLKDVSLDTANLKQLKIKSKRVKRKARYDYFLMAPK